VTSDPGFGEMVARIRAQDAVKIPSKGWSISLSDNEDRPVGAVLAAIHGRRSVREGFDGSAIAEELLVTVVRGGLAAPSSKNARPWRLHVVTDRALLADIADAVQTADGIDEYVPHDPVTGLPHPRYVSTVVESAAVLREASAGVFVENRGPFSGGRASLAAADRGALTSALVGFELELVGLGAAIENMWLAAEAVGLSAAFMGDIAIAQPVIATRLTLAGDLVGVLALGRSVPGRPPHPRPVPAEDEHLRWYRPD
jgi:nitroreductase